MPAEVFVTTPPRSLLQYLLEPLGIFARRALRESNTQTDETRSTANRLIGNRCFGRSRRDTVHPDSVHGQFRGEARVMASTPPFVAV